MGNRVKTLLYETLLRAAQSVPAYKHLLGVVESTSWEYSPALLRRFPLLEKSNLQTCLNSYRSSTFNRAPLKTVFTGGTTGTPLRFFRDTSEYAVENAFVARAWKRMNVDLGKDPGVILQGRELPRSPNGISYKDKNNVLWIDFRRLTTEGFFRVVEQITKFQPSYIRGYGSLVAEFARYCAKYCISFPGLKGVAYSSDGMELSERKRVREVLCDNLIGFYGQTERVAMAATCEMNEEYHVFEEYGFVELIREDGTVIDKIGETGEIVGTSLYPRAVAFIRYRTGDLAAWADREPCLCGRNQKRLGDIHGRVRDKMIDKHGRRILFSPSARDAILACLPYDRSLQFVHGVPGRLLVRIEKPRDSSVHSLEEAINALSEDFHVEMEWEATMERSGSGKRRLFVVDYGTGTAVHPPGRPPG